jgi:Arc/MetJ-type ribon-helix-helix transcriptional regulator
MIWAVFSFAGGFIVGSLWDTIFEPVRREIAKALTPFDLSVDQLADLAAKGIISEGEYIERVKGWGFSEDRARELLRLRQALLSTEDVYRAWRLGLIDDNKKNEELVKLGYTPEQIRLLDRLTEEYPSVSDIIRFAVREVFNEEVVAKYGYDQDIPQTYLEWAKKLGLSEEFAKWYWRAHWEIPSPSQAIELLSRGVIEPEDFDTILKIHDVAPYWRPRLLALAYDPYTRVDIRRMYELGLLDDQDLIKAAKAVGYATKDEVDRLKKLIGDPAVAEKLFVGSAEAYAEWIKSEVLEPWRNDIIRAIRKAYVNGLISREKAREYLMSVGFNERLLDVVLDMWDVAEALDALGDRVAELVEACKKGLIEVEAVVDELRRLGVEERVIRVSVLKCTSKRKAQPPK